MAGRVPDAENHPNLYAWAAIVGKFKDDVMKKWPAGKLDIPTGSGAASASAMPTCASNFFSGACANKWEDMLSSSGAQFLLGAKPT